MRPARPSARPWALAALLLAPLPALAQSALGCTGLDERHRMASVEGADGTFFAIDPDLHLFHPFSDETADALAALSRALASQGTTLVFVPLPTRSLAMPEALPPAARDLGYDATLGATLYEDALRRLDERGVLALDARRALRAPPGEEPSFFRADPRLTSAGARRAATALAQAIAAIDGADALPRGRFETRATGAAVLPSPMRDAIQRRCLRPVPEAETATFVTTRADVAEAEAGGSLFGAEAPGPGPASGRVALLAHEVAGDPALNLGGFLSESTGLEVQAYSVPGGDAFAAISSYLTSRGFQDAPPAILVWAVPISESLAARGDQPMAELAAAAAGGCFSTLPAGRGASPSTLVADLAGLPAGQPFALLVDGDGAPATRARLTFTGPGGETRSRFVVRDPAQVATGRFFVPLTGLWPEGARAVEIALDAPFGPDSRVAACGG